MCGTCDSPGPEAQTAMNLGVEQIVGESMKQERAYTAVQETPTSFCMDWPVFESEGTRDNHFQGTVFVLDCRGAAVGDAPLPAPRNRSADEALNRIGWVRSGASP